MLIFKRQPYFHLNQESKKSDSDAAELPEDGQHNATSITIFTVSQLETCPSVDETFGSFLPPADTPNLCPKSSADHLVSCRLASDVSHPPGWDPQGWKRKWTPSLRWPSALCGWWFEWWILKYHRRIRIIMPFGRQVRVPTTLIKIRCWILLEFHIGARLYAHDTHTPWN